MQWFKHLKIIGQAFVCCRYNNNISLLYHHLPVSAQKELRNWTTHCSKGLMYISWLLSSSCEFAFHSEPVIASRMDLYAQCIDKNTLHKVTIRVLLDKPNVFNLLLIDWNQIKPTTITRCWCTVFLRHMTVCTQMVCRPKWRRGTNKFTIPINTIVHIQLQWNMINRTTVNPMENGNIWGVRTPKPFSAWLTHLSWMIMAAYVTKLTLINCDVYYRGHQWTHHINNVRDHTHSFL